MRAIFNKLTTRQVNELHNVVQSIMQSFKSRLPEGWTQKCDDSTESTQSSESGVWMGQIQNRNSVIAELGNITIFILQQVSKLIQEKEDLLIDNQVLNKRNKQQENQIYFINEQLQQLKLYSNELSNKIDILSQQKQTISYQIHALQKGFIQEQNKWKLENYYLEVQLGKMHQKIILNQQNQKQMHKLRKSIAQLSESNQKLRNELLKNGNQLRNAIDELQYAKKQVNYNPNNSVAGTTVKQQQDISIQVGSDTDIPIQDSSFAPGSSNLKLQLQENNQNEWISIQDKSQFNQMQTERMGIMQKQSDEISQLEENQHVEMKKSCGKIVKNFMCLQLEKLKSTEQSDRCSQQQKFISQHSYFQPQVPNKRQQQQFKKVETDIKQPAQNQAKLKGIKKKPDGKMSRIKFLMNALGEKEGYNFKKKQKFGKSKLQNSQLSCQRFTSQVLEKKILVKNVKFHGA